MNQPQIFKFQMYSQDLEEKNCQVRQHTENYKHFLAKRDKNQSRIDENLEWIVRKVLISHSISLLFGERRRNLDKGPRTQAGSKLFSKGAGQQTFLTCENK